MYLFSSIILCLLIFSIVRWNDYREKELVDVLDADEIEKILYNKLPIEDDMVAYNRTLSEQAAIDELIEFFSQYKVKKTGPRNFTSKYPDEQFVFDAEYKDGRITIPTLIERDIALIDMDQYGITNGPIDYTWLAEFMERQE